MDRATLSADDDAEAFAQDRRDHRLV